MIVSVHIADVGVRSVAGVLRHRPQPGALKAYGPSGLRYGETLLTGRIAAGPPRLVPGRAALLAAWEDDAALDRFLTDHPLAQRLASGWHIRLRPLRIAGSWGPMPVEIAPEDAAEAEAEEPVAVLTFGRLRLRRAVPFLRANSRAAGRAAASPGMMFSAALARPPRFVSTFSVWRSARAMNQYAYGTAEPEHIDAVKDDRSQPFHHESAFVRFRPYGEWGTLDGRRPLADAAAAVTARSGAAEGVRRDERGCRGMRRV
ncbi:spheroidene monooxygenase [Streptomyces sp. MST-110588]|uniref:spheroidene monooxygenase n=1 Tax=Streptomyces sp. MST-110588 TaxID=2833628 RepID=UPI001F5CE7BA|nr:spheroidene monooxygenase [Streptomyces sp. MST-110588]